MWAGLGEEEKEGFSYFQKEIQTNVQIKFLNSNQTIILQQYECNIHLLILKINVLFKFLKIIIYLLI